MSILYLYCHPTLIHGGTDFFCDDKYCGSDQNVFCLQKYYGSLISKTTLSKAIGRAEKLAESLTER